MEHACAGRSTSLQSNGTWAASATAEELNSLRIVLGSAACVSEILRSLDSVLDLARASLVCKLWSTVALDDSLWAHLRQSLFGDVSSLERIGSAKSWFATRSRVRSSALTTRVEDGLLERIANVSENGDMAVDTVTHQLVLLVGDVPTTSGRLPAATPKLLLLDASDMRHTGEVALDGQLPDGPALLACNGAGLVCATVVNGIAVCDLQKRLQVGLLQAHAAPVISLQASGPLLLSSCTKQVCIWSLTTSMLLSQHTIQLNLPFLSRLDTYTRALSDISHPLGLAAFCAINTITPPNRHCRGDVRRILPLPVAHVVQAVANGQVIHRLQLTAVLGMRFHGKHLLVLSLLTSERVAQGQVVCGGTATISMYNTTTWESTKLISPWLEGLPPANCCFQVAYGFAAFVHKNDYRRWQLWGFDLALSSRARGPTKAEAEGGVMCVMDSDRLPLLRLWQHDFTQSGGFDELGGLCVLSDKLLVKTQDGAVHRLGLKWTGCPGVIMRGPGEGGGPRGSILRHGGWLV